MIMLHSDLSGRHFGRQVRRQAPITPTLQAVFQSS
uniref:Uncharacterized protein n=1 Tax=Anguilla anguilla TaxID=7936 RepID=A0A0E9QI21_ANGAN